MWIPVGPEAANCTVADLPPGVCFEPGKLTIEYDRQPYTSNEIIQILFACDTFGEAKL